MQVWNVLHTARWKYRTQKSRQKSPSGHHLTTFTGYIFATEASIDHRKILFKHQYLLHMSSQYGELRPTNGWDRLTSLGYPCKFQLFSRLGSVTARHIVMGVIQTLRRWTEGATYIRQGDHHVWHWPTFLVTFNIACEFNNYFSFICVISETSLFVIRKFCAPWRMESPVHPVHNCVYVSHLWLSYTFLPSFRFHLSPLTWTFERILPSFAIFWVIVFVIWIHVMLQPTEKNCALRHQLEWGYWMTEKFANFV